MGCANKRPLTDAYRNVPALQPAQRPSTPLPSNSTRMPAASTRQASGADLFSKRNIRMTNIAVDQSELDRLRIKRVPTEVFVWGEYRYSNAQDAIAAALRAEKR